MYESVGACKTECLSVFENERLSVTKSECRCMSGRSAQLTSAKLSGCACVCLSMHLCLFKPLRCKISCVLTPKK